VGVQVFCARHHVETQSGAYRNMVCVIGAGINMALYGAHDASGVLDGLL